MSLLFRLGITFLFLPLVAWAQTQSTQTIHPPALEDIRYDTLELTRYRIRGTMVGTALLRDEFLSPLRYTGLLIAIDRTTFRQHPNNLRKTRLVTQSTAYSNGLNENLLVFSGIEYGYSYLFPLRSLSTEKTALYLGGTANGIINLKIHLGNVNNVLSYDVALSVGPSGLIQRKFTLFNRTFMLTEEITLPVLAVVARPPYAWPFPYFSEEGGKFTDALQVGSWNRYLRVQNQLSLDFYWKQRRKRRVIGKNAYRLTYQWDFQQYNRPNKMQMGTNSIFLGRIIKF